MLKKSFIFVLLFFFALTLFSAKAFLTARSRHAPKPAQTKPLEINITLIEGWQIADIAAYLENKGFLNADVFFKSARNFDAVKYRLLASRSDKSSLEGYIFPDTYRLFKPESASDESFGAELIKKALDNFELKFTPQMLARAEDQNISIHRVVILASIIEKETGRNAVTKEQKDALDQERKNVASVFYNRLKAGMAMESDATINFATGKNNPAPTQTELETVSPYNTYKNKGLPPGPICNPSLSSILATLYPAETNYYFFLHKQPSGEPVFSKTFEEHVKNKFKYLK